MYKIMIVDDEEDIIKVVKTMLESEGFEVITALSGRECLDKLKVEKPDYILLDIAMPEMDGWMVLNEIQSDEDLKTIPVAMLTVRPPPVEVMRRKDMGYIVDYITKPFTKEDVIETIKQVYDV